MGADFRNSCRIAGRIEPPESPGQGWKVKSSAWLFEIRVVAEVGLKRKGWFKMSTHQRHTTAVEDRVPWNQLIAYGMGGLVPVALFNIAGQLTGLLGNISLGLSAFWLGVILIAPKLWDALSDPVVGYLTDNTRTRWGRRRPFILVGGIATAISFVAIWWVPRGEWIQGLFPSDAAYNWFQLSYILVGVLVFFTACTVFEIPHGALGMEMSADYHERTRLFSAKSFLGNLFAMGTPWLIFLSGLQVFRGTGGDLVDGMRWVSMFIAAVLVPLSVWWFLESERTPEIRRKKSVESRISQRHAATAIDNGTFINLVAIIFTLAMGFNFVQHLQLLHRNFLPVRGRTTPWPPVLLLGLNGTAWAVTGLLAVVPLNWLSRRIGKNHTLIVVDSVDVCRTTVQNRLLRPATPLPNFCSDGPALRGHVDVFHFGLVDGRRRLRRGRIENWQTIGGRLLFGNLVVHQDGRCVRQLRHGIAAAVHAI